MLAPTNGCLVVADDHIGQSRSARFSHPVRAPQTSPAKGRGTARRRWRGKVGRPRAIVSRKAPVSRNLCALAHVRREASPPGSHATLRGRIRV